MGLLVTDKASERAARSNADPDLIHRELISHPSDAARRDPFTAHVFACALSLGIFEAGSSGATIGAFLGLRRPELSRLIESWAPGAASFVAIDEQPEQISYDEEEDQLRRLLELYRADSREETSWLLSIVARRSMSQRHLWQDLGLAQREELSRLLYERFPGLVARNSSNMKWKKFFYRTLCELEGFVLCAAPTCRECGDFFECFGDENGESALARIAHQTPRTIDAAKSG